MEGSRRQKLVEYLYPTKSLMNFMCNDVYQELLKIIPANLCISSQNISTKTRNVNFELVKNAILNFILDNDDYRNLLFEHYKHNRISIIVHDVLIGLVLYVATINERYWRLDIFRDKKSICAQQVTIMNFL